jgi:hypothetical protein
MNVVYYSTAPVGNGTPLAKDWEVIGLMTSNVIRASRYSRRDIRFSAILGPLAQKRASPRRLLSFSPGRLPANNCATQDKDLFGKLACRPNSSVLQKTVFHIFFRPLFRRFDR